MRLKRLELQGFKTFASRATLEFAPGITAIVGPNGSGKSNIADSVRWVLGEQSLRLLRGRRVEDVIFAGGAGRAPVGMAEVVLTLDNADGLLPPEYTEVGVARRAHRSGENEYYLNKTRVRLRDVVDLLSRAGIGQHGHTVIGQGHVDLALSLRPEERRGLFEDATGLRRYQTKRDEAEGKLAEVKANATRVADLVAELEPRLAQLQRQARRAQDEARLREQWRAAVQVWLAHQRWEIERARQALAASGQQLAERRREATAAASKAEAAVEQARRHVEELEGQLTAAQGQRAAEREALEAARRDLAVQQERRTAAARSRAEQQAELQRLTGRLERAQRARQAAAEDGERAGAELAQAREAARVAQEALKAGQARDASLEEGALQRARGEAASAARAVTQATTQLREVERQRARIEQQAREATEGRARAEKSLNTLASRLEALDESARQLETQLSAAQERLMEVARQRELARARRDERQAEATRLDRELDALQTRLALLQEVLHQPQEGESGAPASRQQPGQSTVAEALRVPPELEAAVAAAAGPALEWVLVETLQEASELALSQARRGGQRTTYAPREVLIRRATSLNGHAPTLPSHDGGVGFLWEAIGQADPALAGSAPAPVRPAATAESQATALRVAVVGHAYVVGDLSQALTLLRRLDGAPHPPIVTLNGEAVHPTGAITAGAPPGEAGVLRRLRELRETEAQLASTREARAAVAASLAEPRQAYEAAVAEERRLYLDVRELGQRRSRDDGERRGLAQQRARLEQDLRWWVDFAQRAAGQQAELAERLEQSSAERGQAQERLDQANLAVQRLATALQRRQAALSELREREAAARRAVSLAEQRLAQATQAGASAAREAGAAQEDLEVARERLARAEATLQELGQVATSASERIATLEARVAAAEQAVEALRVRRAALAREVEDHRRAAEAARQQLALAERDAAVLSERTSALAEREAGLREHAARELGELPEARQGDGDESALRAKVESLQTRIRNLGPVNQVALQEHAEASERLQLLKTQLNDLHETAARLEEAKAELEAGLQADFGRTFEAVAGHFRVYFRRLFGGGEAELRLTDPKNLAETGVEIMAQLPGKRRQELALLSGGERALVAVALLFALLKARPSPFCVLDEVDAALDEANVGRFCDVLEELSAQTQFVLITHNRGTMERASALYGVTLGEDGVSRVLSLRLGEAVQLATQGHSGRVTSTPRAREMVGAGS
ncbi:MAG TPA: chromosome segregation protein SMC [Chloroflexota bacterium]|nr:chromosome segregation protein SMC [Chloroflexota bacterium]